MGIPADGETGAPRSLPSPLWRHRRVFCACQRQNGFFQCGIAEQGASGAREDVEHGWACSRWYRHTPRQVSLSARDSLHALGHTVLCFWKWFVQFQSKFDRFPDRSRVWKVIIMNFTTTPFQKWVALVVFLGLSIEAPLRLTSAQVNVADRVTRAIEGRSTSVLRGHLHPLATAAADQGPVGPGFHLDRITMMFKPTGAQQASLATFLDQLHNPSSPEFQHWLTPEQFADRFGMSRADMDKIVGWLRAQGFVIEDVAPSRLWITFAGNARQVESAFKTEIHHYVVNGTSHYANAIEPAVPDALADVVLGLQSLHNFRVKPRFHSRKAKFTSSITGNHFLVPDDLTTIYDIKKAYSTGIDGTGRTLAVMGQTDIFLSDIETFRSLSGLPAND